MWRRTLQEAASVDNDDRRLAPQKFGPGSHSKYATSRRQSAYLRQTREQNMAVTYYVVVPFDRDESGNIVAGEGQEAPSASAAERKARSLALERAGAVAFSRTGDPAMGEFQDAVVLAQFGEVDLNALSE
jgi:hypothetical protein